MESKNLFSHTIYEVIDSETQKYSSLALHGGDRLTPLQSTTTFHSDQGVWLRDVATGKDKKFEFENFNIAVRAGHKLACVWDTLTNELEAVVNFSTDMRVLGINNFSKTRLCTWFGITLVSLLCGLVFLIPYLASFICFISFILGITPVCGLKTRLINGYRIGFLIAALVYIFVGIEIIEHVKIFEGLFKFMINIFVFNFFFIFSACTIANNYVKRGRSQLKDYVGEIEENS